MKKKTLRDVNSIQNNSKLKKKDLKKEGATIMVTNIMKHLVFLMRKDQKSMSTSCWDVENGLRNKIHYSFLLLECYIFPTLKFSLTKPIEKWVKRKLPISFYYDNKDMSIFSN